jgi:hypothetical protein
MYYFVSRKRITGQRGNSKIKWLMTYCDKINYKNHLPLELSFLSIWSDWFLKANPCFHAFTSDVIFKHKRLVVSPL